MTPWGAGSGPERACPLCGAGDARTVLESAARSPAGTPYRVVACAGCGLRYTRPLPDTAELRALYPPGYHPRYAARLWSRDVARILIERRIMRERRRALARLPRGRLLDVGCGGGAFLASLRDRGWDVQTAPLAARARFLAVGLPVLGFSLLYAPSVRALTGHAETMTVTFRPAGP